MSGVLGRLLGRGAVAEVFEHEGNALKLYTDPRFKTSAFREAANLAAIEPLGIPAPRVLGVREVDGRWAVMMTLAEGRPLAERMMAEPASLPPLLDFLVAVQRKLHSQSVGTLPNLKSRVAERIAAVRDLEPGQSERLAELLRSLPDGNRVCHGDFHPWNILGGPEGYTIVDWLDATAGAPEADACRSYLLLDQNEPGLARTYLESYLAASGSTEASILAWLPALAAARLAENVPEHRSRLLAIVAEAVG